MASQDFGAERQQKHRRDYLIEGRIGLKEGLNWKEQYSKVKGKVSGGLWSLKKLMKIAPQSQLVNIYHTLVESHVRYANVVWGSLSNTKLEGPQRLQNRAQSIIERAKIRDQWPRDWLTVEQLINFDRSVMT